jgi:hypothetical protein
MEQAGREDVHVAVPEASGDDQALAVDDRDGACEARGSGGGAWADGGNATVVNENGSFFLLVDRWERDKLLRQPERDPKQEPVGWKETAAEWPRSKQFGFAWQGIR